MTGPSQTKRFGDAVSQFLLSFFAFLIPGDRRPHFSSPSLKLASTLLSASPQIPRPDGCGPPKLVASEPLRHDNHQHLDSLVVTFGDLRRQAQATRHQIRRREYLILCSENQHPPRASACCPTTASLGSLAVNTRPTDKDGRAAEQQSNRRGNARTAAGLSGPNHCSIVISRRTQTIDLSYCDGALRSIRPS